jgi:hypothetical protein
MGDREIMQLHEKINRDLGEIHEKVNKSTNTLSTLCGRLDEVLPRMATTDSVKLLLAKHERNQHRAGGGSIKRDGALATLGGALATIGYALFQLLS